MDKICPMMSPGPEYIECVREMCGFWDWKEKQCAIVSIGIGSMEYIREKER